MDDSEINVIERIAKNYLDNNEIAEIDQFYSYYINEISNQSYKPIIMNKNQLIQFIKSNKIFNYNDFDDTFFLSSIEVRPNLISEIEINKELFSWNIIIQVNVLTGKNYFDISSISTEIANIFQIGKENITKQGPFWGFDLNKGSSYIVIKIRDSYFEISSYVNENESEFMELLEYILKRKLNNEKQTEIILLFPQIGGLFNTFQKLRKVYMNVEKEVSFEIADILIRKGKLS